MIIDLNFSNILINIYDFLKTELLLILLFYLFIYYLLHIFIIFNSISFGEFEDFEELETFENTNFFLFEILFFILKKIYNFISNNIINNNVVSDNINYFFSYVIYKLLYFYSYLQILFKKYFRVESSIHFVKNGEIILNIIKYNYKFINLLLNLYYDNSLNQIKNDDFDIIIYNDNKNKKNLILNDLNDLNLIENKDNYKCVDYSFFSFMVCFLDKNFNIILKNDKYNFLFDKNFIDKNFILYYFKSIEKNDNFIDINIEDFDYTLRICDNNFLVKNINNTQKIIFELKKYNIKKI